MQKATSTSGENMVVTISRFGRDPLNVTVPKGATVGQALANAGIDLEGREELFVAGVTATNNDVLENGDILSIVTPKQAG